MNIFNSFLLFAFTTGFAAYCKPKEFLAFSSLAGSILMGLVALSIIFLLMPAAFFSQLIKSGSLLSAYGVEAILVLFALISGLFSHNFYQEFRRENAKDIR